VCGQQPNHKSYGQSVSTYEDGGGLQSLHEAGDYVTHWQDFTAATALAE